MEEYRAFVKQQLFDGRHGGALNHAKDQILGQLADAAEGEIPSILVETPTSSRCRSSSQQLQMQRMSLTTYLSQIHETRESFTAKVRAAAEKNTRARMALLQIAQQENLLPTDEEIDKQLAERAEKTKRRWRRSRQAPTLPPCAATRASARLPIGSSTTPPSRKR